VLIREDTRKNKRLGDTITRPNLEGFENTLCRRVLKERKKKKALKEKKNLDELVKAHKREGRITFVAGRIGRTDALLTTTASPRREKRGSGRGGTKKKGLKSPQITSPFPRRNDLLHGLKKGKKVGN